MKNVLRERRQFIQSLGVLGTGVAWQAVLPAWAKAAELLDSAGIPALQGKDFDLHIREARGSIAGKTARHITLNDQFPAPLLRWREGDELTLRVHNHLAHESSSIHWHGILLPWQMDGVPGLSFDGIPAGKSFTYSFPVRQSGTYWYHSHSGLQEQLGHYGPIIIDPKEPEPFTYEREYVVMLSDWTFENPQRVFSKLKKMSDNYNFQQRTVGDFFHDVQDQGLDATLADRMMWGDMRMSPTDFADVTGATYTYLVNGHSPAENWTGLFRAGERIRLRLINASAMSIFNVRIPGLAMTVVQADGLNVQAVETDELQIGTAETFDVIVQPAEDQAYTLMAESSDGFGYARATLAPRAGMEAPVPPLRERPPLTMKDMGMGDMAHDMPAGAEHGELVPATTGAMDHSAMDHAAMGHTAVTPPPVAPAMNMSAMDHAAMGHTAVTPPPAAPAMDHSQMAMQAHPHPQGYGVAGVAMSPVNRLNERPAGLTDVPHRVLVYTDLHSLLPRADTRAPHRELQLHLTGNMERYMWSFDGRKFSEVSQPIGLAFNERVRLTFVNDTMMPHPIHLHGMFFDVVTGDEDHPPRKHTLVLKPGEIASVDLTADAPGNWAFHCHLLYHMHAGMMRVVSVQEPA